MSGGVAPSFTHATLSPDERFIVINQRDDPGIVVVDLTQRRAESVPLRGLPKLKGVGGVTLNWAASNHGLLAVHGETAVGVFTWKDGFAPALLGYAEVERPRNESLAGPYAAISWSTDGTRIIAAQGEADSEFGSWEVAEDGQLLVRSTDYEVCANRQSNWSNDIPHRQRHPAHAHPLPKPGTDIDRHCLARPNIHCDAFTDPQHERDGDAITHRLTHRDARSSPPLPAPGPE